jgi:hypothetical protein
MLRLLLVLALLSVPALAAPRLKDRKPALDPEGARIAALKAKFEQIRKSGTRDEQAILDFQTGSVELMIRHLDEQEHRPHLGGPQVRRQALEDRLREQPVMKDLYDITMYDRKKAAEKK